MDDLAQWYRGRGFTVRRLPLWMKEECQQQWLRRRCLEKDEGGEEGSWSMPLMSWPTATSKARRLVVKLGKVNERLETYLYAE